MSTNIITGELSLTTKNKYYEIVNGVIGTEFNGLNELLSLQVYGGYAHTRRGVSYRQLRK